MYPARSLVDQYRQTRATSAVLDADPHQVIAIMLSACRDRVRLAAACIQRGDIARKGECIVEASTLIGVLNGALDHKAGGEIAAGLASLYDYVQRTLVQANLASDAAALEEVDALLGDIEGAWKAIAPGSGT